MNIRQTLWWLKSDKPQNPWGKYSTEKSDAYDTAIRCLESIQDIEHELEDELQKLSVVDTNLYRDGKRFAYEKILEDWRKWIGQISGE